MSKALKELITSDLRSRYAGFDEACVVDVTRLDVVSVVAFRRDLRARDMRVEVVKNSLARRAFEDTALAPLARSLEGPCALVTGSDSIVDVAKVLVDARKQFNLLELKTAIVEGDAEVLTVEALSKMKSRHELIAEISGLIASPCRSIAGCLQAPAGKIAGCLKAMAEKAA